VARISLRGTVFKLDGERRVFIEVNGVRYAMSSLGDAEPHELLEEFLTMAKMGSVDFDEFCQVCDKTDAAFRRKCIRAYKKCVRMGIADRLDGLLDALLEEEWEEA
jgi:hypothetical protein